MGFSGAARTIGDVLPKFPLPQYLGVNVLGNAGGDAWKGRGFLMYVVALGRLGVYVGFPKNLGIWEARTPFLRVDCQPEISRREVPSRGGARREYSSLRRDQPRLRRARRRITSEETAGATFGCG